MITTATADHLHLVDFPSLKPTDLQTKVTQAIDNANAFLDELDKQASKQENSQDRPALTASQALQDIIEFDHINLDLDRHWGIVSHLNSVMSNDDIRHVHHELLPKLSAYGTRVGQHQPLFARYQAVANDTEFFGQLDEARRRAIELALRNFALSGVALPKEQQAKYADIQSQLSTLSAKFSDNVLDATQAFALPLTQEQLAGIPESGQALLADAGERFKEKQANDNNADNNSDDKKEYPTPYYVATLDMPVYLAIMTHADDRQLREQIYQAFTTRASEFDKHVNGKGESLNNADIMVQILALRQQKAELLDLDNYAQLSLSTKMADTPEQVEQFLRDLASQANPTALEDLQQLQEMGKQLGIEEVKAWDIAYLAEKVKQQKFSLSQEEIRPYFPLPTVIDGLFSIVQRLYGIRIEEHSEEVARWHDDVRFYQLFDENNSLIGGFYFDLYARQGKRGGAWMSGFQPRYAHVDSDYQQLPVCFMVANFTPAIQSDQADKPSLLTHNEVLTLFHEFGHGLHHLLTQVSIGDVAGVNGVEWDAVELPSQFMENWAWDAEGIALISSHVETGEPLPEEKLQALLTAKNFQSGMQTLRQIEFALFDLLLHSQNPAPDYAGILQQLQQVRADIAIMDTPDYNRFANGFSHIFAGGYASGYYSYKWAELLSADAFSKFEEEGIFNPQTGKAFRESILAVGGSRPAKTNFEAFRGRPANIEALLRHSGFTAVANNQDSNNSNNSKAS